MSLTLLPNVYYENEILCVKHSAECALPGYFVLSLKKPCTSISALDDKTYLQVMLLLKITYQVTERVVKPEKIYICSFCEVQPQLHFHIFPRTQHLTAMYLKNCDISPNTPIDGPQLFKWTKEHYINSLSRDEELILHDQFVFNFENNLQSLEIANLL